MFELAQFSRVKDDFIDFYSLQGMQVLVDAREKLEIPWEHPNTELAANQAIIFHSSNDLDVDTFRQYAPVIHRLWQDRAIKKAYDRRREFQLVSFVTNCFLFSNPVQSCQTLVILE